MAARRVSLPAADDLFRPTAPAESEEAAPRPRAVPDAVADAVADAGPDPQAAPEQEAPKRRGRAAQPSGRVRHDEKMTVYITSEELLAIEHARLALRGTHGLAVDRGRLVREALALVLAEFEAEGEDSALVRRLSEG